MINDLVSIITPAYNSSEYIREAIESVIAQTYKNWEMIIVDDASQDNTYEILNNYANKDKRIKPIFLEKNCGAAYARNRAIECAQGRYIAFLDSDDLWKKEKLEKQLIFMKKNKIKFSYHDYELYNIKSQSKKIISVPYRINYTELLKGNNTGSCVTVCIDRKYIKNISMPNIHQEDFVCWLNVLRENNILGYGLNKCLGTYRIGKESTSSNKFKSAYWTWQVYRKSQKLSLPLALYYMSFYIIKGIKKYILP